MYQPYIRVLQIIKQVQRKTKKESKNQARQPQKLPR